MHSSLFSCIRTGIRALTFVERLYFFSFGIGVLGMVVFCALVDPRDQQTQLRWLPVSFFLLGMSAMGLLIALRRDRRLRARR